jgi:hypothetical protein
VTAEERDALIEAGVSAHRERDLEGRPVAPPAWWDLAPEDLDELHRRQMAQRVLERLVGGRSGTVQAVIDRI